MSDDLDILDDLMREHDAHYRALAGWPENRRGTFSSFDRRTEIRQRNIQSEDARDLPPRDGAAAGEGE